MLPIAEVRLAGVGSASVAEKTRPVTELEVAKALVACSTRAKPVMYVCAAGLRPILPVIDDPVALETPVFARMTYPLEEPRSASAPTPLELPQLVVLRTMREERTRTEAI